MYGFQVVFALIFLICSVFVGLFLLLCCFVHMSVFVG